MITNQFKPLLQNQLWLNSYTSLKSKISELKQRRIKPRRLQHVAKVYQASPSMVSLIMVIAGRRRIPLYGPTRR